jgi:lactoylglutathione lyase
MELRAPSPIFLSGRACVSYAGGRVLGRFGNDGFAHRSLGAIMPDTMSQGAGRTEDAMHAEQDAPVDFKVRLRYATVRTRDLDRSVRFYEDVLGLQRTRTESGEFVQLNAGGAELCVDLSQSTGADAGEEPALIFAVDDLAALCRRFQERGIAIVDRGPDNRYVIVRDPDGYPICFER